MKKLMIILGSFFFVSLLFTSCGPSPCDCAESAIQVVTDTTAIGLTDATLNWDAGDYTEEELEDKYPGWNKCKKTAKYDKKFEKEMHDCLKASPLGGLVFIYMDIMDNQ